MPFPQQENQARNGSILEQQKQALPEVSSPLTIAKSVSENQRLLIEAYLKLLDMVAASQESTRVVASITKNRYLVYVHGISQHQYGYSNSWWQALQPYIGKVFEDGNLGDTRQEVLWSDLVNSSTALDIVDTRQKEQLKREILAILEDRQRQEIAVKTGGGRQVFLAMQTRVIEPSAILGIDDFLIYMLSSEMRQQIINRFTDTVKPLLGNNNQIDIISHSWGTVVAYEGLRELEAEKFLQGQVSNFFTVGSALSIGPVRTSLRPENQDGRRPSMVNKWINLDAQGDLVGGMLGDMFEITQENLGLQPAGCLLELFGYRLSCAHGSYFVKENTTVNRDIFAHCILE
ncbi:hypothetical protein B6N60_04357 [Richelia sinica FACHB-800]|uniref:Alpha/beta hydrolase n=1 Tax=Richelia sinica FACHB-800 TaxID=1357546 RepID=A0A975TCQ1_9NOST|nr:hypothetical protein [Richelia sinica]MBD2665495.1 hypothetical protein [Richelia sinica FACHB-800]QXE25637.1 hypothetical protein B6N60_04357 [Richelia sinica FACHB-800]